MRTGIFAAALIALLGTGAGCQRTPPLEERISASSPVAFLLWRARVGNELSAEQWREFDAVIQEIKFKIMADREATGSVGIDEAMRRKIDGRTVRNVLQFGYEAKLHRLEAERSELESFMAQNALLRTRPGDNASADYLAQKRANQSARLEAIGHEISLTHGKLKPLTGMPGPTSNSVVEAADTDTPPQRLPPGGKERKD